MYIESPLISLHINKFQRAVYLQITNQSESVTNSGDSGKEIILYHDTRDDFYIKSVFGLQLGKNTLFIRGYGGELPTYGDSKIVYRTFESNEERDAYFNKLCYHIVTWLKQNKAEIKVNI